MLILTAPASPDDVRAANLSARGARVEALPASGARLGLPAVPARLAELEANEVLVEAGPTLAGELTALGLVDELLLYVAPRLRPVRMRALVHLPRLTELEQVLQFALFEMQQIGADARLRLRPQAA